MSNAAAADLVTEYTVKARRSLKHLQRRFVLHLTPWLGGRSADLVGDGASGGAFRPQERSPGAARSRRRMWMTSYTKVLSRFVNTPGLKLEISFEAPAAGDQAKSKGDETRTALRELGLSEDIEIR